MNCVVIIPAAGTGSRFGGEIPKQYLPLRGQPLIVRTVERFLRHSAVSAVVICVAADQIERMTEIMNSRSWDRVQIVEGGETRHASVRRGVTAAAASGAELVAIHDAVRPFFRAATFDAVLAAAREAGAAIPVMPMVETIHRVEDGEILETPDRENLRRAQTPQCFRIEVLRKAMGQAATEQFHGTDEAAVVRRYGGVVRVVYGDEVNIKITTPEDLQAADQNYAHWSLE